MEPDVIRPLSFNQDLLVCNAYPGNFAVNVKQNGRESTDEQKNIRYQECRHLPGQVNSKDKMDFIFANSGVSGTFEIGDLPDSDAMLLLVVEKRDSSSSLVAFQSFAFPSHSEGKNAQLAVIDTYKGSSSSPHLKMEDHINTKEPKTISKRVEQLNFNRIYAIEEGTYDASISDHILDKDEGKSATDVSKKTFRLAKHKNYVILRTGGGNTQQSLVVYPPELAKSASAHLSFGSASILVAAFAAMRFW